MPRPWASAAFALLLSTLPGFSVDAQERPFAFAFSPGSWNKDGSLAFVAPGYSDAAPPAIARDGFESRVGVEARVWGRLSLLGDVAVGETTGTGSPAQFQAEALYNVIGGQSRFRLAAGTGYRRELEGHSVWLGRFVGERDFEAGRVLGDLRLEKPFVKGRDAVDVIVTLAATRRLGRGLSGGAELVGEDLEAIWEKNEAEGGGRILLGPSLHWRRSDGRVLATVAGGPVLRVNATPLATTAQRDLGNGFALRFSLAYVF